MPAPVVSVVVPVHNAMPYLLTCIDSVLDQTIGPERLEVIAVDDGSTDGSGDALDDYAKRHPDLVRVVHREASGTPSVPRNLGLDLARGEYVFFLDADDHFGPQALERMVAMAEANDADVVLGRMKGVGGRGTPKSMFRRNQPRADLYSSRVYWTLGAWKLFRRSLLERHGIRFPEDRRSGEDQAVTCRAYVHARNIAVVADYDCYYFVLRDDGGNLTGGTMAAPPHTAFTDATTLDYMAPLVAALVSAGPKRDYLMKRHWEVEGVLDLDLIASSTDPAERERRWNNLRELVRRWYTPGSAAMLAPHLRLAYHLVAQGDLDGALAAHERKDQVELVGRADGVWAALPGRGGEAGPEPGPWTAITDAVAPANWLDSVAAQGSRLRIAGTARLTGLPSDRLGLQLECTHRATGAVRHFALDHENGIFTTEVDLGAFGPKRRARGVWDVAIVAAFESFRLAAPYGLKVGGPLRGKPRPRAQWRDRWGRVYAQLRLPAGQGLELEFVRPEDSIARAMLRRLRRRLRRALHA